MGVLVDTQPSHLGRRSPYIGSIAVKLHWNRLGSVNSGIGKFRLKILLNSLAGPERNTEPEGKGCKLAIGTDVSPYPAHFQLTPNAVLDKSMISV